MGDDVNLLFDAIRSDNVAVLEAFVHEVGNYDVTISKPGDQFLSRDAPLICVSAFYGAVHCFTMLQINGANMYATDGIGASVAHFASCGGSTEICDVLDSIGTDFTAVDRTGMGCVHYACMFGRIGLVQRFHSRGFSLDEPGRDGFLPVHFAAHADTSDVMAYLLDNGCDMEAVVKKRTPFLIALKESPAVLRELLARGAKTAFLIKDSRTPLMEACFTGNLKAAEVLVEFKPEEVDASDEKLGWTALMYAAYKGHLDIVKMLVEHGADVNKESNHGFSPAMAAFNNDHMDVVSFLVEHGANYALETQ